MFTIYLPFTTQVSKIIKKKLEKLKKIQSCLKINLSMNLNSQNESLFKYN